MSRLVSLSYTRNQVHTHLEVLDSIFSANAAKQWGTLFEAADALQGWDRGGNGGAVLMDGSKGVTIYRCALSIVGSSSVSVLCPFSRSPSGNNQDSDLPGKAAQGRAGGRGWGGKREMERENARGTGRQTETETE